jgi:hypothetical protein
MGGGSEGSGDEAGRERVRKSEIGSSCHLLREELLELVIVEHAFVSRVQILQQLVHLQTRSGRHIDRQTQRAR